MGQNNPTTAPNTTQQQQQQTSPFGGLGAGNPFFPMMGFGFGGQQGMTYPNNMGMFGNPFMMQNMFNPSMMAQNVPPPSTTSSAQQGSNGGNFFSVLQNLQSVVEKSK